MINLRNNISLKKRILLLWLLPLLFMGGASIVISYTKYHQEIQQSANNAETIISSAYSASVDQALKIGDVNALISTTQSIIKSTDIEYIRVNDGLEDVVVVGEKTTETEKEYEHTVIRETVNYNVDELFEYTDQPVTLKYKVATIYYSVNEGRNFHDLFELFSADILLLIVVILIMLPVSVILNNSILNPIKRTVSQIEKYNTGDQGAINSSGYTDEYAHIERALHELILKNEKIKESLIEKAAIATEKQKAADHANASKDRFVQNVTHELKTPLSGVVSSYRLIEEYLTDLLMHASERERLENSRSEVEFSSMAKHLLPAAILMIDNIKDSSKRMGQICDEVIAVVDDVYTDIELVLSHVPVVHDFHVLAEHYKSIAGVRGIELRYEIIEGEGIDENTVIEIDWIRCSQVIGELIDNAIRFNKANGMINLQVTLSKTDTKMLNIHVTVSDTGIGILEYEKEEIFNMFHITENPATKRYSGLGNGLAIAKKITEKIGGRINLDSSEKGVGSVFSLNITTRLVFEIDAVTAVVHEKSNSREKKYKVLYVEDSKLHREIFGRYAKSLGFEGTVAEDGYTGLDRALQEDFDIILLDLHMPGKDGWQLASEIRAAEQKRNLIVSMTALNTRLAKQQCEDSGFDHFLNKPLTPELFQRVFDIVEAAATSNCSQ